MNMKRTPCPSCNLSGKSEYPGQLVSFTSAPTPCGCGDGFIDDPTPVEERIVVGAITCKKPDFAIPPKVGTCGIHPVPPQEYKRKVLKDSPPKDVALLMTLAPASDKAPVMWKTKLLTANQKLIDESKSWRDWIITSEQKPQVIPTGIPELDKIIGGGWRPGINVVLGKRGIAEHMASKTSSRYLMVTSSKNVRRCMALGAEREPSKRYNGCCLTTSFNDLLTAIRRGSNKLVVVDDYRQYLTSCWNSRVTRMQELHHAAQEAAVTLILTGSFTSVDVSRTANIVVERRGTGPTTHYVALKSRWCAPGETTEKPVTRCISQEDFDNLVVGDVFSCRMDVNPHDLGVAFQNQDDSRPGVYECTGRRRTEKQKQAEFAAAYGKHPVTKGLDAILAPKQEPNEITVTIAGVVGSGKSTILDIVNQALREHGVTASVQGEDREWHKQGLNIDKRLAALKQSGLSVVLDHKQLPSQRK